MCVFVCMSVRVGGEAVLDPLFEESKFSVWLLPVNDDFTTRKTILEPQLKKPWVGVGRRAVVLSQQRANLVNFYGIFSCENFKNFCVVFFTHTRFYFHVWVFKEIFTHTFLFSRTVFQKFSRKENKFHGWKAKNSRKFSRKAF